VYLQASAQFPQSGVGLVERRQSAHSQCLEALEQRDVATLHQPLVEEHVRRGENR
jgi:hypothetical protein